MRFLTRPFATVCLLLSVMALLSACKGQDAAALPRDQVQVGTQQNRELAARIVADVSMVYALPTSTQPTVAVIQNVDALRRMNSFYNRAKNGDYLIVTSDRALLYDAQAKRLLDVVPIKEQASTASSGVSSEGNAR